MEGGRARAEPTSWISDTLKSTRDCEAERPSTITKAHERSNAEARSETRKVDTSKGIKTTKEGASDVSANHTKRSQRIRSMLTSSKPIKRMEGNDHADDNDMEDTAGREASGATSGEKPSKDKGSPWTSPTRNKVGEAGCGTKRRGAEKARGRREARKVCLAATRPDASRVTQSR
jgi:hypothetical protein